VARIGVGLHHVVRFGTQLLALADKALSASK
jgi:hypothetical protein